MSAATEKKEEQKDLKSAKIFYKVHPDIAEKLAQYRKRRNFNPEKWSAQKTRLLNMFMTKCGMKSVVVNVSGGIDSSVTLGLVVEAAKLPDSPIKKIYALSQPIESTKEIWQRALEIGKSLGVDVAVIDQTPVFQQLVGVVESALKVQSTTFARGQLKSYMRTPVAYFVSQIATAQGYPAVFIGTGNWDEDGYLRYFCKAGDGISDIQLINDLHKSEVFAVGAYLKLPESVLKAQPSADLWVGQTAVEEIGFTYDFVEVYMDFLNLSDDKKAEFLKPFSPDALAEWQSCAKKAESLHQRHAHKAHFPLNLNVIDSW